MATVAVNPQKKTGAAKRKKAVLGLVGTRTAAAYAGSERRIGAGEFKAKCLAIIDEVGETGQEVIITKRGKPAAKLIPFPQAEKRESIIGRLEGIIEIVGDPDDLIKPVFPEEDWDMLK